MILDIGLIRHLMKASAGNAETSIEFAIDNVLERISLLNGEDQISLIKEYKEWLDSPESDIDILVINYIDHSR